MIIGIGSEETYESEPLADPLLLPEDALELGVSHALRIVIFNQGGLWTAQRVVDELTALGWQTTATYPLNLAGNMLNRLNSYGALRHRDHGVYSVDRDVLGEIITRGVRAYERDRKRAIQDRENHAEAIAPPS